MDWRSIRFDWNRARAFLVTAEEGSFSAAARALQLTQPTVGRQVAALEEELGVALFERIGNTLQITEPGLDLVEHVKAMGEAATRVSLGAAGQSGNLEGTVCITASQLIAAFLLPAAVARLRREHPRVELEIVADNELRDLQRREADIAIRNVKPQQPELFAKKLRDSRGWAYATPAYLDALGDLEDPERLARLEIFGFGRTEMMVEVLNGLGLAVTRRSFPIITDNHLVQWELCKRGLGVCFVMEEVGEAEPSVRRALPQLPPLPVPLWLTSHRELRTSRRMRLVFDLLAEELGE